MAATTMTDPVQQFVAELLRAGGFDALPEAIRGEFADRLRDQVQHRIGLIAAQHLDDAGLAAFTDLMAQPTPPSPEVIQSFFEERIPDFAPKLQEGLLVFAQEFLAAAKRDAPSSAA